MFAHFHFLIIVHTSTVTLPRCVRKRFFFYTSQRLRPYTALRNMLLSLKYVCRQLACAKVLIVFFVGIFA